MKKKWLLGYLKTKDESQRLEPVYLEDFEWSCGWYWSGGYIGNAKFHAHFDGAFLNTPDIRGHSLNSGICFLSPWQNVPSHRDASDVHRISNGASVWEDLSTFLKSPQYDSGQWWRIKDLFKQFYALQNAAEVFQYGGHCTSTGRNPSEINKDMANSINKHIETVIIPEIRKALDKA